MKYALSNDARARAVAKDLARLSKERGVKLPLTSAQNVTARLFGYVDWQSLLACVGQERGPEDHELSKDAATERRVGQIDTLVKAGFGKDAAAVLDALRPTGREQASIEKKPRISRVQTGVNYHPNRMRNSLNDLNLTYVLNEHYDALPDLMNEWGSKRFVHPLDREIYPDWTINSLIMKFDAFCFETGHVVDVSAIVSDAPDIAILDEKWTAVPKDPADLTEYYFHFGNHRFPSPFKDIGIDGCYVSTHYEFPGEEGGPSAISITFTTSPEIAPDFDDVLFDNEPEVDLRSVLRVVEVIWSDTYGEHAGSGIHADNESEHSDEYVDAWRPYLEKPLCAAWTALKAYRQRQIPIHDALYADSFKEDFLRLERATTDNAVVDRMRQIAENCEMDQDFPVRFMGKVPPSEDIYLEEMAASPFPRADSGPERYDIDHVHSKLADALQMERPWSMYLCAKEALRMCGDLEASDPATEHVLLKSCALIMNAANMIGAGKWALEALEAVTRSRLPEVIDYLPGAVIVLVRAGLEEDARNASLRLAELAPGTCFAALSELLVAATFSERHVRDTFLRNFVENHEEAAKRILRLKAEPWNWFSRDGRYGDDEIDYAACMFKEPLNVAGIRDSLKALVAPTSSGSAVLH
ncbi:hypothetical protein D3C71_152870 [compost metagenome]